jgi:hypothetical protein
MTVMPKRDNIILSHLRIRAGAAIGRWVLPRAFRRAMFLLWGCRDHRAFSQFAFRQ